MVRGKWQKEKGQCLLFLVSCFFMVSLLLSCNEKHTKDDGHSHDMEVWERTEAEHHTESPATVASLTPDQIKAVGIAYGVVEMKELTSTIRANGNLKVPNDKKANATSLYGGVVKTIHVQVGDYVRKGQVIATIVHPQFLQLQEDYLATGNQVVFAEQEYNRQKELFDNNAGAKKNLQHAESELKMLRTKSASLQKQLQLMGIRAARLSDGNLTSGLTVTAPISGTISNVVAQIGSYVDVAAPVAGIVDNASLHLDLNVFEKDLPMLKVGQTIHFTLTNNPAHEYDAEIFSIGAAFEDESKTIPVHARVISNKEGLIDGMNITGIVSLNNVLTPAVPKDAIVNADGKYYIFIVTDKKPDEHHEGEDTPEAAPENGTEHKVNFEKIEVMVGVTDMGYAAITPVREIPKGAKIVVKGAFFINAKLSDTGEHEH